MILRENSCNNYHQNLVSINKSSKLELLLARYIPRDSIARPQTPALKSIHTFRLYL